MVDFSQLQKLEVTLDRRVWCDLYEIRLDDSAEIPALQLAPATDVNKPYYNGLLRRQQRNAAARSVGKVNAAMLEQSRDDDRELFTRHVVLDWRFIRDAAGEEVPFSTENCREFLKFLPTHVFDRVRVFAGDPANFPGTVDTNVEITSGNSRSG